jgi:hypothetical protein
VLGRADRPSSQVASLSTVAELLKAWVDAVVANRVHWGTRSLLVTALSYFLELDAKLELLGLGRNTALMEDQVDALWILARLASDLIASHILPSVAHDRPNGTGE